MTRKHKPYKTYTKKFKQEAVSLLEESGRPAAKFAMELGIRRNQFYKWKQPLQDKGEMASSGNGGRPRKVKPSQRIIVSNISKFCSLPGFSGIGI